MEFRFPSPLFFGAGCLERLAQVAEALRGSRPLVVTDPQLARTSVVERAVELLRARGLAPRLFHGLTPDPEDEHALAGAEAYLGEGADLLVAVGGGSSIDAAKAIRHLVAGGTPERSDQLTLAALHQPPRGPLPPLIAIPTTAGTGSEVTNSAVLTDSDRRRKFLVPRLMPSCAICDPELTLSMPPAVTAATGFDALAHLVEAMVSRAFNPFVEAMCLHGTGRVLQFLPVACEDARSMDARTAMMEAALMGGLAIGALDGGVGAAHALAHTLGVHLKIPHGQANALVLPHAMRFNLATSAGAYARLAHSCGLASERVQDAEAAEALIDAVAGLARRVGLLRPLRELGFTADLIPRLSREAKQDITASLNPRPCSEADFAQILRAAL